MQFAAALRCKPASFPQQHPSFLLKACLTLGRPMSLPLHLAFFCSSHAALPLPQEALACGQKKNPSHLA